MKFENEFEELITEESIQRKLKTARLGYEEISVKNNQEEEYIADGWTPVETKRYKSSLHVRRNKRHEVYFEDRVWSLFAGMKFLYMNEDRNFRIQYATEVPGKQIDVFAADDQVVLVIECKSAEIPRKANFAKDINEINGIRENIGNRIKKHFKGKPKIAWIFCTNNILLTDNDTARLKENKIIYLDQNDIKYYEDLLKRIGSSAKYQLFGRFFAQQTIPELKSIVPAVKGNMGSYTYYSFSIEPETLLQISYIMHRTQTSEESLHTYQRMVNASRIKEIGGFIDDGGFFPNAIIVNIDTKNGSDLQFDVCVPKSDHHSQSQLGLLHLPQVYRSAYIIDGQHRLYGYANSKYIRTNTIPVVAFENLPAEVQTNLFVDINSKQKSVNRNLLSTLDAELRWNSPQKDDAIKALKSKLAQMLTEKKDSPLYDRIITGEVAKTDTKCITLAYFCDYGLNKCKFFGELQGKRLVKLGYLCDGDDFSDLTLEKAYQFFKRCFKLVENRIPAQWNKGEIDGGFIGKNIGVASYVVIANDIFDFLEKAKSINCSKLSAEELYDYVEPYLITILTKLEKLSPDDLASMTRQYGGGGVEKVRREFQRWINEDFSEFNPVGLEQYIKDSSGRFNEDTRKIILSMQTQIRDFIFEKLKQEYQDGWWAKGVPNKIQHECAGKYIDGGREEEEWNYLELMHYQEIIKSRWHLLGKYFTPPRSEQESKENKISWFVRINSIRNRVMHPERDNVKEDEYNFVMDTYTWINERFNS